PTGHDGLVLNHQGLVEYRAELLASLGSCAGQGLLQADVDGGAGRYRKSLGLCKGRGLSAGCVAGGDRTLARHGAPEREPQHHSQNNDRSTPGDAMTFHCKLQKRGADCFKTLLCTRAAITSVLVSVT